MLTFTHLLQGKLISHSSQDINIGSPGETLKVMILEEWKLRLLGLGRLPINQYTLSTIGLETKDQDF